MSGLVAYGSSSDEEEDVKAPPPVKSNVHGTRSVVSNPQVTTRITTESECGLGCLDTANGITQPLIGPTVPSGGVESFEDESSTPSPVPLSERDTVRYLTQATHPMSSIPESPPGSPDPTANARFRRFLELKGKGVHFNEDLSRKFNFRNPSLLATMMSRVGIEEDDQYAIPLPTALWDPSMFPPWAYKEELLKSQQNLREKGEASKKAQSVAGKRTIDFAPASNSGASSRHSTPGQQGKRRKP